MSNATVRRRAVPSVVAALAGMTGLACGPEGATAPLAAYPCQVGWALILIGRDRVQDYYYERLSIGVKVVYGDYGPIEVGDSIDVALDREAVVPDGSGLGCVATYTRITTPWTFSVIDGVGAVTISQPSGAAPGVIRAVRTGDVRIQAVSGHDSTTPASLRMVPRVVSLVVSPADTVSVGAAPVRVRLSGRDSAGLRVPLPFTRTRWAVLSSSSMPVAQWPSVELTPLAGDSGIDALVRFPSAAAVGTANISVRTRHASATVTVTVPPVP